MAKFTNNRAGKSHLKTALYSYIRFVFILITLFISVNSFCQTLVSENFENATFPPAGWVVVNAGAGNNWVRSTSTSSPAQYTGSTAYMLYGYNSAAAANTWAFTPILSLIAGTNYVVEFQEAAAASSTYPENLKVTIGNAQTVASQTTTLLNLPGLLNTTYIKRSANFTVATSGNYSIAFNCYSAADEFNLAVDEIKVRIPAVPDAPPTSFTTSGVTQTGTTIGWTDNSTNETSFKVYRSTDNVNFTQIGADITSTSSATTGTTYSSLQTALTPGVTYYYRVASSNADGISTFLTGSQATLAAGNVVSVGTGGLWSSAATWSTGAVPASTDNVTIADGSTVTIDIPTAACLNLTVGQGTSGVLNYINTPASALSVAISVNVATNASFNAGAGSLTTHNLTVGGNLTNDGTLDLFTTAGVGLTFNGAANNSFSGTGGVTDIRTLTINKGNSSANILELSPSNFTVQGTNVDGAPMSFLTLTNGTLKVSGSYTLTGRVFSAAAYTIPATAGFWLNNPNFTVIGQAGNATNNGLFRLSQGVFNHGTATGNIFNLGTASSNIIEGGSINCTGRFGTTAAATIMNYSQTGGTITVCTIGYTSTTLASFDLGTSLSSVVNISGGTIVCQLPNSGASGPRDFRNNGGAGIATVTGGTLQLGNALSGTAKSFVIGNVAPNILVTSASGNHTATFTTTLTNYNNVSLNITTQPGATINLANGAFLFNGNTITNNGIFTHNGTSSRFITFSPATNITFTGSGTVTSPVTSLELQNDLNFTITSSANIVVGRIISFSGSFVNANKLTLGTGGSAVSTIQIGNTTTPTGGGTFDVAPTFNLGTGGQSISYLRTTNSKITGPEINPARTLVSLTYDDDNAAHTLTVTGGALSTGTLNLTNGKIINGTNLITVSGTTTGSIVGGSATSYVAGPLARTLPASLATGSTYTFPIGKSGLNAFELVNPTTNAGGTATIRAEVFDANSGGTPGNLMSAISTSRYWAASLNGATAANFTGALLRLNDTRGTQDGIAASATVNGVYDHVGGTASTLTPTSITTTPPALTSIGNFYLMGNLGAAVLTNLAITPAGNQCVNVPRTVTVTATPSGAPVTSVVINYRVNGGTLQTVTMTNTGGNNYSGTIPTVTPSSGTVTWSVVATDGNNLVATANGTPYADEPLNSPIATASVNPVCSGTPTVLSAALSTPLPVSPAATSYCASTHTSGCSGDNISNVVLNTLNNATGTACGGTSHYTYFNAGGSQTTTLAGGSTYSLSVTFGTDGSQYFGAWIDYNHNGTYEASEFLAASGNAGASGTIAISFTIPATAYNGITHLRLVGGNDAAVTSSQACGVSSSAYGETQDYDITITGATPGVIYAGAATYSWSDGATVIGTTNPLIVNPTSNSLYTVTVTAFGCTKVSNTVSVTTNALPNSPEAHNSTQCGTAVPAAFVTTGGANGTYRWYSAQTGGTLLQNGGQSYTNSINTTTSFWVSESDGTCESLRTEVIAAVVSPDPIDAIADNTSACANSPVQLTVSNIGALPQSNTYTYSWTAIPAGAASGLPSSTPGSSITVTPTAAGTYKYVAKAIDGDCITTDTVTVIVGLQPVIDSLRANPGIICSGASSVLKVYSPGLGAGPQTPPTGYCTTGLYTSGCGSFGDYLANVSFAGVINRSSLCDATATGTAYSSYGTQVPTLTAGQNYPISVGTTTADVEGVTVWIDYNRNGVFEAGETAFAPGFANSTGAVYSGTITIPSNAAAGRTMMRVRMNYNQAPAPSGACASVAFGETEDYVVNIIGIATQNNAYSYTWNPGALTGSTVTVTPASTQLYTVTVTNPGNGCSKTGTVTVNVNPLPAAPSGTHGTDQCGTGLTNASVSSNNSLDPQSPPFFKWYLVSTGGSPVQSGTSTTYLTPITSTTTFYVSEVSVNGCEGPRVSFTTVVSAPDPLTVSATDNSLCITESTDISSAYTPNFNDFATFTLTASPLAGSGIGGPVTLTANPNGSAPYTVTPTTVGTFVYTITANDPDKGCNSVNTVSVTVTAPPAGLTANVSPTSTCSGGTVNLTSSVTLPPPTFNEGFTTAVPAGWAEQNLSTPPGTITTWSQGIAAPSLFDAHSGAATSYARASFNNVAGANDISNWLFAPAVSLENGAVLTFWTRTVDAPQFADRLEVRMSTNGSSVNVGTTATSVGDYSTLLVSVNPTLNPTGYPNVWTKFTVTISGLGAPVSGRIAFRYSVPDGGPDGTNSDNIGLDDVSYSPSAGVTYSWTSNPPGFTSNQQNPSVVVNQNTSYTVTATTAAGCSVTAQPVTVTVLPVAASATAVPATPVCAGTSVTLNSGGSGGGTLTYSWSDGTSTVFPATASITVSPVITTTYTVTVTDGCAATATSSVTVTVNPLPTAGIQEGPGPLTLCDPATQTLTAVTNAVSATYQWTLNGNNITLNGTSSTYVVSGAGTGTYRVIVTNTSTNCVSAASSGVVVTINPRPSAVVITPAMPVICNGGSVGLVATGGTISATPTLGTGTSITAAASTTSASGPNPFQSYYGGSKQQMLITAAELTALGMSSGTSISAIAFTMNAVEARTLQDFQVKMQNSPLTSFASTTFVSTGFTVVRTAASYTPVAGINNIPFTTNFVWDGTSSIIIETNQSNNDGGGAGGNRAVFGATTYTSTLFYRVDFNTAAAVNNATTATYSYSQRNNIRFSYVSSNPFTWTGAGLNTNSGASVIASPGITTTYVARATSGAGCFNETSVTVTVNPRPTGVLSGSGTYCAGQGSTATTLSIAVTGAGPWTGTITDGTTTTPFSGSASPISVSVTPTATTTYTIATLNGSACSSIAADLSGSATVTVNPTPATPTVTAGGPTTFCSGGSVVLTSSSVTGNQWNLNGAAIAGATNQTLTVTASGDYTVTVTNGSNCAATSTITTITVNPTPATPTVTAGGPTTFCSGGSVVLTSSSATGNQWNLNGTAIAGATNQTLTVTASGNYTVTVTAGSCSATSTATTVTVNPLAANVTATVTQPTCTVASGTVTVTAPLGAGITYSLDGGAYQPGTTFSNVAPGTHTLTAQTVSGCFSPASTSVTVNAQPVTPAAPVVSGIVNVCPYLGTGQQLTYTATAAGATGFTWTLPPHVNLVTGQGTSTLVVTFDSALVNQVNKQLRVKAVSSCGSSAIVIFYLTTQIPAAPAPISGIVNICPYIGTGTVVTYTIPSALSATRYLWSVPAGTTVTHPNIVNPADSIYDTVINVVYNAGFVTGGGVSISVTSRNGCGLSGTRTLQLSAQPAATPGLINGPTNVCANILPGGTAATYSVSPVSGAVSYTWTWPSGATVSYPNGQGVNGYTISVLYPQGFNSGTMTVSATNGCGTGGVRSLSVTKLTPSTPSNIDVIQTGFCGDVQGRVYTYTLSSMPANATSVQWTIPATGATFVSGQGTTSITVSYGNGAVNGNITAQAQNNCGVSGTRSVIVKLPVCSAPGFAGKVQVKEVTAQRGSMEVKIFPNPTVSDFKLEVLSSSKDEVEVRVIDVEGRLYKSFKTAANQTISLGAELKAGSYMVEVRQGGELRTTKLVKF